MTQIRFASSTGSGKHKNFIERVVITTFPENDTRGNGGYNSGRNHCTAALSTYLYLCSLTREEKEGRETEGILLFTATAFLLFSE
jgi:hypothetical protein